MGVSLTTTITCDICKKKIKLKVKRILRTYRRRGSHNQDVYLIGVYVVNADSDISITPDPEDWQAETDKESRLCCSIPCVEKAVSILLPMAMKETRKRLEEE
jgi:hypothetical protein